MGRRMRREKLTTLSSPRLPAAALHDELKEIKQLLTQLMDGDS